MVTVTATPANIQITLLHPWKKKRKKNLKNNSWSLNFSIFGDEQRTDSYSFHYWLIVYWPWWWGCPSEGLRPTIPERVKAQTSDPRTKTFKLEPQSGEKCSSGGSSFRPSFLQSVPRSSSNLSLQFPEVAPLLSAQRRRKQEKPESSFLQSRAEAGFCDGSSAGRFSEEFGRCVRVKLRGWGHCGGLVQHICHLKVKCRGILQKHFKLFKKKIKFYSITYIFKTAF